MRVFLLIALCLATPALAQTPRPVITEIIGETAPGLRAFSGVVEARIKTSLAFRTGGRVARLYVEAGDPVKAGTLIAELDQITLAQDLREAEASVGQAKAALDYAQASYDRAATLRQRGVIAQSDFESARASLASARASVESARAQARSARQAAGYGRLYAPTDGIILSRAVEPGTLVSAGTEVVSFARGAEREAVIALPQALALSLAPDQTFSITHHAEGVAPISAKLRLVEPVANSSLDTLRTRLALIDPSPDYRVGSLVSARLEDGMADLVTVPKSALVAGGAPAVWVVSGSPRKAHLRQVSTGADLGARIAITAGLSAGDEIVLRGLSALSEGEELGAGLTLSGRPREEGKPQ